MVKSSLNRKISKHSSGPGKLECIAENLLSAVMQVVRIWGLLKSRKGSLTNFDLPPERIFQIVETIRSSCDKCSMGQPLD